MPDAARYRLSRDCRAQEIIVSAQRIVSPYRCIPQTRRADRLSYRIVLRPGLRSGQSQRGAATAQAQAAPATQRADTHRGELPTSSTLSAADYASPTTATQNFRLAGDHLSDAGLVFCSALVARQPCHSGGAYDCAQTSRTTLPQREQRAGFYQRQSQRSASRQNLCPMPAIIRA